MAVARKTVKASAPAKKARVRVAVKDDHSSDYFTSNKEGVEFISSGCVTLDEALGGGWVEGRVANIVGDRSAGKTLLAIEAAANFNQKHPDSRIRYAESEAAFDESYAEALGMPIDAVDFNKDGEPLRTVEDWHKDITSWIKKQGGKPGMYILDSLDALSDEAEAARDLDQGSYGANKAKKMGEIFRRIVQDLESSRCTLIVISQLRDKLNVSFGETKTRSGGRALDFYCTHIVWLAEIGKLKKTIDKVERVIGANVRAKVKKNKIGLPFRECDYPVLFGYGVDDITSGVEWLINSGCEDRLADLEMSKAGYKVRITSLRNKGGAEMREIRQLLQSIVRTEWRRIDQKFLPKSRKY